jgi:peptide/nickel transport system permease protein
MLSYTTQRAASALLLMLLISVVAFFLIFASGDPAVKIAGEAGSAADAARIRQALGFDRPIYVQFLSWLGQVLQGNLGRSIYFNQPVAAIISDRVGATLTLSLSAMLLAVVVALPLGIAAARWQDGWVDKLVLVFAAIGQAMPSFWFALLLIIALSVNWQLLPTSGSETWLHFVMPAVALAYYALPTMLRLTRAGMIETLEADYIRTSRAMGVPPRLILFKYALRNAVVPVVGVAAAQFGSMLAGSIVIESIFALNGVGRLAFESIQRSDLPTVQALVLCFSLVYIVLTFLADLLNAWIDPRMRSIYGNPA